jgi:23S rRNA (guanine745-N1)-methyltransferase
MALARRRVFDRGLQGPVHEEVRSLLAKAIAATQPAGAAPRLLDIGCGEGGLLRRLFETLSVDGAGIDLSTPALDFAARASNVCAWIAANADRILPIVDDAIDFVVSVNARVNPGEFHRVLRRRGSLIVALPAPDDLCELRAVVLGDARERDRFEGLEPRLAPHFTLVNRRRVSARPHVSGETLSDLLALSYRGQRTSAALARSRLEDMRVTTSWDIGVFARVH